MKIFNRGGTCEYIIVFKNKMKFPVKVRVV